MWYKRSLLLANFSLLDLIFYLFWVVCSMNVSKWSFPGKEARQCGGKTVERDAYLHGVPVFQWCIFRGGLGWVVAHTSLSPGSDSFRCLLHPSGCRPGVYIFCRSLVSEKTRPCHSEFLRVN